MSDEDIMSTPINQISENDTVNDVIKNFEDIESTQLGTDITDLHLGNSVEESYYEDTQPLPPKVKKEPKKPPKKVSPKLVVKKSNIMSLLKPLLVVFLIIFVFSYPLFDTKILKLIPKTLDQYDSITFIGLVLKSILGAVLFALMIKFI